jgi:hypothetical protein
MIRAEIGLKKRQIINETYAFIVSWFYKIFTPTTILVTIFHICTCDDVTVVNEKSIVSWKYMKSNKKCVFNVNFQYNHKQVPTAYFSMMFNIHKHIYILINFCVGTRVWRVWNLQSKNNLKVDFSSAAIFYWPFSSVIDRNRNRPFNLIQNKVGYLKPRSHDKNLHTWANLHMCKFTWDLLTRVKINLLSVHMIFLYLHIWWWNMDAFVRYRCQRRRLFPYFVGAGLVI